MIMSGTQEDLINLLKKDVLTIIEALVNDDPVAITQGLMDMGARLKDKFPEKGLDDLRKIVLRSPQLQDLWTVELPNLRWVGILSEAKIRETELIANYKESMSAIAYDQSIHKMDALGKGLNIFSVLLDEKRMERELTRIANEISDEEIDHALPTISISKYEVSESIIEAQRVTLLASNALITLRVSLKKASEKLNEQITEMAKVHSSLFQSYLKDEEFQLERWVKDFDGNKEDINASLQLLEAVAAYKAVDTLNKALDEDGTPKQKLMRVQEKFNEPDLRKALTTNPDDERTALIKLLTYIAKSVLSLSIYHWVDKKESLRSPQQQLMKESLATLKNAEDANILEPPEAKI